MPSNGRILVAAEIGAHGTIAYGGVLVTDVALQRVRSDRRVFVRAIAEIGKRARAE